WKSMTSCRSKSLPASRPTWAAYPLWNAPTERSTAATHCASRKCWRPLKPILPEHTVMTDSKPNESQNNETPDTGAAAGSDIDWEAALAEQTAAQRPAAPATAAAAAVSSAQHVFQPLAD